MARRLSALLGLLAAGAAPITAGLQGATDVQALWSIAPHALAFAAVGYVVGLTADWAVETSVRQRMQAAVEASVEEVAAENRE